MDSASKPSTRLAPIAIGLGVLAASAGAAWLDGRFDWVATAFEAVAHMFYENPLLAALRRASQVPLVRMHLLVAGGLVAAGCIASPWLDRHGRRWVAVFVVAYVVRAVAWIAGGNLPMVSGDSPHYVEVASSILRGEGPVKHYVESFFRDYPPIREGKGVVDDWATPLFAQVLALAYRMTGVNPGDSLEATVAIDKGVSFTLNLLCFPALYFFARRRLGRDAALGAVALLAVLPVHAIYAGFDLRESLVALTAILAVWFATEVWSASGRSAWVWAVAAGVAGGAAVLARNTAMATLAAVGLFAIVRHFRKVGPMILWGVVVLAVIAPWAYTTYQAYGEPFYTYTKFFQYTFSWPVHHFQAGEPRAADFYTWALAPTIARVKIKSLAIIVGYAAMIFSLPLMIAFFRRAFGKGGADVDRLVAWIGFVFVAATLANIADVTQVAQLGRYYLPLFVLMLPTAAAGLGDWWRANALPAKIRPTLVACLVALLWADPTWAYDASWYTKPYQLHWPSLRAAGDWVKAHPEKVPPDARIMTWFPWEFRLASGRTTVLLPRNFDVNRLREVAEQYRVTHVLWGSFEIPAHIDPEAFGPAQTALRKMLGMVDDRELFRSPKGAPYEVRLYRLGDLNR